MGLDDEIVTRVRADTTDFDRGMQQAQQSAQKMATGTTQAVARMDPALQRTSAGYRGAAAAALGAANAIGGLVGETPRAVNAFQMINFQVASMSSALARTGGRVGSLATSLLGFTPIMAAVGGAAVLVGTAFLALDRHFEKVRERAEDAETALRKYRGEMTLVEIGTARLTDEERLAIATQKVYAAGQREIEKAYMARADAAGLAIRSAREESTSLAGLAQRFKERGEVESRAAEERRRLAVEDAFARARGIGATAMTEEGLEEAAKARAAASAMAELGTGAERAVASMAMLRQEVGELPDAAANAAQRATEHMREWETAISAVTVAHQSLGMVLGSSVAAAMDVYLGKSIQLVHADREAAKAAKQMELSKGEAAKVAARDAIKAIAAQAVVKAAFMYAEAAAMYAAAYFGYTPGYAAGASALIAAAGYTALGGVAAGAASQIGAVRRTIPSGAGSRGGVATTTDPFGRAGFGPADTQDRRAPIIINIGADATSDPLAIAMAIERRLAGLSRERGSREFRV